MLQFFNKKTGQRGFTLIELLVVIAIIGILATIVLVSLNSARQKARDSRRVSDLRQIQLGEEIYYDGAGKGSYSVDLATLATSGAMAAVPKDPSAGANYDYCIAGGEYGVGAQLEDKTSSLMNSSVAQAQMPCSPNVGKTCAGAGSGYYCVSP